MSYDVHWDIDEYREEHESEDHWQLRRAFMDRWKNNYPEDRLVCLARVFANIELLGCRYPTEVMQEVAGLAHDIAQSYRKSRKNKLQRTFVSASEAAEDRAKGIKREGGVVKGAPSTKSMKIEFVPQGHNPINTEQFQLQNTEDNKYENGEEPPEKVEEKKPQVVDVNMNDYLDDLLKIKCVDIRYFNESMFHTSFGRLVLIVRPWCNKLSNIQASCQACRIPLLCAYENGCFSLSVNGTLLAQATGTSRSDARSIVEIMAWNRLREETISILFKEQRAAQSDTRISLSDVSVRGREEFGTPIENSVATKMMQLMGWKGGGLGADAQGIAEPIKPHLQMVNRAGLGSQNTDMRQLKRAAQTLMQRYIASDSVDVDLVFSSEFTKEERAEMHQIARRAGLVSRSYGDVDRFLVVKKKLNPFSLVQAVIEKGGSTPKYQVFIPETLRRNNR